jgi:hypothetical protein
MNQQLNEDRSANVEATTVSFDTAWTSGVAKKLKFRRI